MSHNYSSGRDHNPLANRCENWAKSGELTSTFLLSGDGGRAAFGAARAARIGGPRGGLAVTSPIQVEAACRLACDKNSLSVGRSS
jgi:hypothetical protein